VSAQPPIPVLTRYKTGDPTADRWQDHVLGTVNPFMRRVLIALGAIQNAVVAGQTGPGGATGADGAVGPAGAPGATGSAGPANFVAARTFPTWLKSGPSFAPVGGVDGAGQPYSQLRITTHGWPVMVGFGPISDAGPPASYDFSSPFPTNGIDFAGILAQVFIDPIPVFNQILNFILRVRISLPDGSSTSYMTLADDRVDPQNGFSFGVSHAQLWAVYYPQPGTYVMTLEAGVGVSPTNPPATIRATRMQFWAMEV
jgi:hypothetical protein